jgi:hypothetical protein
MMQRERTVPFRTVPFRSVPQQFWHSHSPKGRFRPGKSPAKVSESLHPAAALAIVVEFSTSPRPPFPGVERIARHPWGTPRVGAALPSSP